MELILVVESSLSMACENETRSLFTPKPKTDFYKYTTQLFKIVDINFQFDLLNTIPCV